MRLRLELRKRRRRHGKLWARIRTAHEEAKDSGRTLQQIKDDYEFERRESSDDIFEIEDQLLLLELDKHGIRLADLGYNLYESDDNDSPLRSGVTGQQTLTHEVRERVIAELRRRQPEVRRERRESIQTWTGLVGTLTGLAAVLLNSCPGQ